MQRMGKIHFLPAACYDTLKLSKRNGFPWKHGGFMNWIFLSYLFSLLTVGANGIITAHIALPSAEIVVLRAYIGAGALFLFHLCRGGCRPWPRLRSCCFRAATGVTLGMEWLFVFEAYRLAGVSLATLAYYCGPAIAMALSPFLFHERLTLQKAAGFLTALLGICLINSRALYEGTWTLGLLYGLLAAVMFASTLTINKMGGPVRNMGEAALTLAVSGTVAAAALLWKSGGMHPIPAESLPWVLFLGFISTALGCGLYFRAASRLPMQTTALWGYLDPLSAVLMAALFLGERLTPLEMAGAACILGGALLGENSLWMRSRDTL